MQARTPRSTRSMYLNSIEGTRKTLTAAELDRQVFIMYSFITEGSLYTNTRCSNALLLCVCHLLPGRADVHGRFEGHALEGDCVR